MGIKVKALGAEPQVGGCCGRRRRLDGLGDPIMMLEGLGAERSLAPTSFQQPFKAVLDPAAVQTLVEPDQGKVLQPLPLPLPPPTPTPTPDPSTSDNQFPTQVGPLEPAPTPPPVQAEGEQQSKIGVSLAIGGAILVAAMFLRGG